MKAINIVLAVLLFTTTTQAKIYTIGSGKWSDPLLWGNQYIGSTIKADDVVIITGQVTMTTSLLIEGTLQIEKGAAIVGIKDLTIAKTGKFVNNGNAVVRKIVNEGSVANNLVTEAMTNIMSTCTIENNSVILAGNNLESKDGNAYGRGGSFYINNTISCLDPVDFDICVNVFSQK